MGLWKKCLLAMVTMSATAMLTGCIYTSGAAFGATTGAFGLSKKPKKMEFYIFDVPPQVIYRIDAHRFFTMENYKDCEHGGVVYYHDTRKNVKRYITGSPDTNALLIPNAMLYWKGDFIYAADDSVIASLHHYPQTSDHSTVYGYFVGYKKNNQSGSIKVAGDRDPGIGRILIITNEKVYVVSKSNNWGYAYPLPAVSLNRYNISTDFPESVEGGDEWSVARTPSGAVRFTCNNSIKPVSVKKTPARVFATDATGVPQYN